ncbi:MAG: hypothetical protein ACFCU4_07400 [Puniceicoccaceae bacterium]
MIALTNRLVPATLLLLLLGLSLGFSPALHADFSNVLWKSGQSGRWNDPSNWEAPSPPRTGHSVSILGPQSVAVLQGSTNQLKELYLSSGATLNVLSGSLTTRRGGPIRIADGAIDLSGGQIVSGGPIEVDGRTSPASLTVRSTGSLQVSRELVLSGDQARLTLDGKRQKAFARRLKVTSGNPQFHIALNDPLVFLPLRISDGAHLEPETRLRLSVSFADFAPRPNQYWTILQSNRVLAVRFTDAATGQRLEHGSVFRVDDQVLSILYGRSLVAIKVLEERNGVIVGIPSYWPEGFIIPN